MIPFTIPYDEYIDLRKLTEQKKQLIYIVPPPPTQVGRNNNLYDSYFSRVLLRYYKMTKFDFNLLTLIEKRFR